MMLKRRVLAAMTAALLLLVGIANAQQVGPGGGSSLQLGTGTGQAFPGPSGAANTTAISAETTRAEGAESTNAAAIATETTSRGTAISTQTSHQLYDARVAAFGGIPQLWGRAMSHGLSGQVSASDLSGTSRQHFVAQTAMHDLRVAYQAYGTQGTNLLETPIPNPVTFSTVYEYPAGTYKPLTFGGAPTVTLTASNPFAMSDVIGQSVPSGATDWVKTFVQVCIAPTVGTPVVNTSAGTLAAGTYYFQVTAVCGIQGESGPSTEVAVTTTGSTNSITLPITPNGNSVAAQSFNVYKASTSGNEVLYGNAVPGTAISASYTDAGTGYTPASVTAAIALVAPNYQFQVSAVGSGTIANGQIFKSGTNKATITSFVTNPTLSTGGGVGNYVTSATAAVSSATWIGPVPPPAQQFPVGPWLAVGGDGENYADSGGPGNNQLLSPIVSGYGWVTGVNNFSFGPMALIGQPDNGVRQPVVFIRGDSVADGQGDIADRGPIVYALLQGSTAFPGGIGYYKVTRASSQLSVDEGTSFNRIWWAGHATYCISEGGSNDIASSITLANLQAAALAEWQDEGKRGCLVSTTDIIPRTYSVDQMSSTSGQLQYGTAISGATDASPIVISTGGNNGIVTNGQRVTLAGVGGNTAANGTFYAKTSGYSAGYTFALYSDSGLTVPVVGNGAYAPAVACAGSISGTTMTVTGGCTYGVGQFISGTGIIPGTQVTAGSGTSYTVNFSQTIGSETITGNSGGVNNSAAEAVREAYNSWLRCGAPVASASSIVAVACGTSGALIANQPGHPLTGPGASGTPGLFDTAATIEVAAGAPAGIGTLTLNGGYWAYNTSTGFYYTVDGLHPTQVGSPILGGAILTNLFAAGRIRFRPRSNDNEADEQIAALRRRRWPPRRRDRAA